MTLPNREQINFEYPANANGGVLDVSANNQNCYSKRSVENVVFGEQSHVEEGVYHAVVYYNHPR